MLILISLSDNMSKRHHSRCNEQSILNRTLIFISQARKKKLLINGILFIGTHLRKKLLSLIRLSDNMFKRHRSPCDNN